VGFIKLIDSFSSKKSHIFLASSFSTGFSSTGFSSFGGGVPYSAGAGGFPCPAGGYSLGSTSPGKSSIGQSNSNFLTKSDLSVGTDLHSIVWIPFYLSAS